MKSNFLLQWAILIRKCLSDEWKVKSLMQELHNQGMAQTKLSYGANARVKLHSQVHFQSKKI